MSEDEQIDTAINSLLAAISDPAILDYDNRMIARDPVAGLVVSTAMTTDMGYETAIIDANGTYPVERYGDDLEAAKLGHQRWVVASPALDEVTMLGYMGVVPEETITLERFDQSEAFGE